MVRSVNEQAFLADWSRWPVMKEHLPRKPGPPRAMVEVFLPEFLRGVFPDSLLGNTARFCVTGILLNLGQFFSQAGFCLNVFWACIIETGLLSACLAFFDQHVFP